MSNAIDLYDSLLRCKRKMLRDELSNEILITLKTHPECDLETRLELGQDPKISVDALPVSPGHSST